MRIIQTMGYVRTRHAANQQSHTRAICQSISLDHSSNETLEFYYYTEDEHAVPKLPDLPCNVGRQRALRNYCPARFPRSISSTIAFLPASLSAGRPSS